MTDITQRSPKKKKILHKVKKEKESLFQISPNLDPYSCIVAYNSYLKQLKDTEYKPKYPQVYKFKLQTKQINRIPMPEPFIRQHQTLYEYADQESLSSYTHNKSKEQIDSNSISKTRLATAEPLGKRRLPLVKTKIQKIVQSKLKYAVGLLSR